MKPLVLTAALALLSARAGAEPIATYEQNVLGSDSLSLEQGGDYLPDVYLPVFNQSLGTLQAVQVGLSPGISASFEDIVEVPNPYQR